MELPPIDERDAGGTGPEVKRARRNSETLNVEFIDVSNNKTLKEVEVSEGLPTLVETSGEETLSAKTVDSATAKVASEVRTGEVFQTTSSPCLASVAGSSACINPMANGSRRPTGSASFPVGKGGLQSRAFLLFLYFVVCAASGATIGMMYENHPVSNVSWMFCAGASILGLFTLVHGCLRPRWYQRISPAKVSESSSRCFKTVMHFCLLVGVLLVCMQYIVQTAYEKNQLLPTDTIRMITRLERVFSLDMAMTHLAQMRDVALEKSAFKAAQTLQDRLIDYAAARPAAALQVPAILLHPELHNYHFERLAPIFETGSASDRERGLRNQIAREAGRFVAKPDSRTMNALSSELSELASLYDLRNDKPKSDLIYGALLASDVPASVSSSLLHISRARLNETLNASLSAKQAQEVTGWSEVGTADDGKTVILDLRLSPDKISNYTTAPGTPFMALSSYKAIPIMHIFSQSLILTEWPIQQMGDEIPKFAEIYGKLRDAPDVNVLNGREISVSRHLTFDARMTPGTDGIVNVLRAGDLVPPRVLLLNQKNSKIYSHMILSYDALADFFNSLNDIGDLDDLMKD